MLEALASLLNFVLWPLATLPPTLSIFLLALFLTLLITCINKIFVNRNILEDLKRKVESLREELIELQKQGNTEKVREVLNEITKNNLDYMKHNLKALLLSLVAILLILPWIQHTYKDMPVAKLPLALPYIGSSLNWFLWYFIASLTIGWIIRKLMGIGYG